MRFKCKECQETFVDAPEADHHAYDVHNMEFEDVIEQIEGENLAVSEETPDEASAVSEEEKQNLERAMIAVDKFMKGELFSVQEKQLLSRLFGQVTSSTDKKAHDKGFPEMRKTKNVIEKQFRSIVERLSDVEAISCPACGKLWSSIEEDLKENLGFGDQHKALEGKFPRIRLIHIKAEHPSIMKFIKSIFSMGADEIKDSRPSTTGNPENVSALSKEELAQRIGEDPEKRKAFFKEWMKRLQK